MDLCERQFHRRERRHRSLPVRSARSAFGGIVPGRAQDISCTMDGQPDAGGKDGDIFQFQLGKVNQALRQITHRVNDVEKPPCVNESGACAEEENREEVEVGPSAPGDAPLGPEVRPYALDQRVRGDHLCPDSERVVKWRDSGSRRHPDEKPCNPLRGVGLEEQNEDHRWQDGNAYYEYENLAEHDS